MNTIFLLVPHLLMVPATAALFSVYTYWEKYHYCLHITSLLQSPQAAQLARNNRPLLQHNQWLLQETTGFLLTAATLDVAYLTGWTCLKYFFCQYKLGGIVLSFNFLGYEFRYYDFHNAELLIYTDSTVTGTFLHHDIIFCISIAVISKCICTLQR